MPSSFFNFKPLNGVRFPSTPGFNLNEANGVFLKRDFDKYIGDSSHPYLKYIGQGNLIPYSHENLDLKT